MQQTKVRIMSFLWETSKVKKNAKKESNQTKSKD
jgi:hypothetical protein